MSLSDKRTVHGQYLPGDEGCLFRDEERYRVGDVLRRAQTPEGRLLGEVMQHLSGGEQQRAWLAVLLAQDAPILLLDEPTTYLDVHHQLRILDLLRRINEGWQKTIVVVLHDMNQAWQYADEVVIMKDGALVCTGPPQAVLTPERLWDVFSVRTDIVTTCDGRSAIVVLQ